MDITPSITTTTNTASTKSPEADSETPTRIQQPVKPLSFSNGVLKRHNPTHHLHHHNIPVVVTYKECLQNHAATLGGHALDGCGQFMPSPAANPADPTSLKCAACGCHRNFHRRDPEDSVQPNTPAATTHVIEYQRQPQEDDDQNDNKNGVPNPNHHYQEEDYLHKLEAPCCCNGTLKPYEAGYTIVIPPPQPGPQTENVTIPIRDGTYFTVNTQAGLQAAQKTARTEAAAEFLRRQLAMQAHGGRAFNASALCGSAAVICLTFLVMKDIYHLHESGQYSHLLTIFSVLLGLFIPSYLIAWCASACCCAPSQSEGDLAVVEVAVPEVPVAAAPQYNWTANRY